MSPKHRTTIFLITLILLLSLSYLRFTGFITEPLGFSLELQPLDHSSIFFTSYQSPIIHGVQSNFTNMVENSGNTPLGSGIVEFTITNSISDTVHLENSDPFTLNISKDKEFTMVWTADVPSGTYTAWARHIINGSTIALTQQAFDVIVTLCIPGELSCSGNELRTCSPGGTEWLFTSNCQYGCSSGACQPEPEGPGGGGGGGGGGGVGPGPTGLMDAEYPATVYIPPGINYTVLLKVLNNGSSILHNIRLSLDHPPNFATSATTTLISVLDINSSSTLTVEIRIPYGIPLGDYSLNFTLTADETTTSGNITVNVTESSLREQCEQLISYYTELLDSLDGEIYLAEISGVDVTGLPSVINNARMKLDRAQDDCASGQYPDSLKWLEDVRKDIEVIVIKLQEAKDRAIPTQEQFELLTPTNFLLILVGVGAAIAMFLIVKKYRKKKKMSNEIYTPRFEPTPKP